MRYNTTIAIAAVLTILGGAIGYTYATFIQTTLYASDARIMVVDASSTSRAENYAELAKSRLVVEEAIKLSDSSESYEQVIANLSATSVAGTDMVKLSVATADAKQSKALLNAIVTSLAQEGTQLYGKNNIKTVDAASVPIDPSGSALWKTTAMAAASGLSLAVLIAFVRADGSTKQRSTKRSATTRAKRTPTPRKQALHTAKSMAS